MDLALGRAVIEFDEREPHDPLFDEDRRRWNRITDAGYHLRVFTWDDVEHDPTTVVRRARRLLDRVESRAWC